MKRAIRLLVLSVAVTAAALAGVQQFEAAAGARTSPRLPSGLVGTWDSAEGAAEILYVFKADGTYRRRVVPSPEPLRIFEIRPIRWLVERGVVLICAGGGGVPTMYDPKVAGRLVGVEAVVDKDLAGELLAREVDADLFVMATDVDGVYAGWGTPEQRRIERASPPELRTAEFAAGSMGPKVAAAVRFVERTGRRAAIGGLADIAAVVEGAAGTQVVPSG